MMPGWLLLFQLSQKQATKMVLYLQEIANKLGLNISYEALNDEYICLLSAAMVSPVAEQYCLPEQACLPLGCLIFMFLRQSLGAVGYFDVL